MKYVLLIFSLFFGCNAEPVPKMLNASSKLGKKFDLNCFGSGIYGPKKIEAFSLDFDTNKELNIETSRKLLVDYMESFIKLANSMPDVIEIIDNPPFTEMHGNISIECPEINYDCKKFCGIEIYKGKVTFLYRDKKSGLQDLFSETYSEAYFKVYGTYPPERGNN